MEEWSDLLFGAAGLVELPAFSTMELAAVGAGSPLRGLVADETFLDLDDRHLTEGLDRARQGLMERGLAGAPVAARNRPAGQVNIPLGGDLAAIVAVRRSPAFVATVCAASPETYRRPGGAPGREAVLAVLHGVASAAAGTFALLEETTTRRGMHLFTLCTPAAQAVRVLNAWRELETEGPAAVSVQVLVADELRPRRTQLVIHAGVARLSSDGATWQRSLPEEDWIRLFRSALAG